jgi:AcrR family transcriptional regulator
MENISREQKIRSEIIAAAQKLFRVHGLDKTTMDDIARAIGKVKGSVYHYYSNKEEIFYIVASMEMKEIFATASNAFETQNTYSEKIKTFLCTRCNEIRRKLNLYPVLLSESTKHMEVFRRLQDETRALEMGVVYDLLSRGSACGEFRKLTSRDCTLMAHTLVVVIKGLDANILMDSKLPSEDLHVDYMAEVFLKGLRCRE